MGVCVQAFRRIGRGCSGSSAEVSDSCSVDLGSICSSRPSGFRRSEDGVVLSVPDAWNVGEHPGWAALGSCLQALARHCNNPADVVLGWTSICSRRIVEPAHCVEKGGGRPAGPTLL